jgi:CheY-like chemotaxis protein
LPLKVLLIEDNPMDVRLTTSILERSGFRITIDAVDTSAALTNQLESSDYDIIISDYDLGSWNALEALDFVARSGKDIPVIVSSGSLGDEAAVAVIKSGATDYVLKDAGQATSKVRGGIGMKSGSSARLVRPMPAL